MANYENQFCTNGHHLHYPKQMLLREKPFAAAKFYRYPFTVECSRCHTRIIKYAKTEKERAEMITKYEPLPVFPH